MNFKFRRQKVALLALVILFALLNIAIYKDVKMSGQWNKLLKRKAFSKQMNDPIIFRDKIYPGFVNSAIGFSDAESVGRWTDGDVAKIQFIDQLPDLFMIEIYANAYGPNIANDTIVKVGNIEKKIKISNRPGESHKLLFQLNNTFPVFEIEIIPPFPISPSKYEKSNTDERRIGIQLISIKLTRLSTKSNIISGKAPF